MKIKRHKEFIKDFKKSKLSDSQFEKFISYIHLLKEDKPLPPEAKDHKLLGNYKDCREFHLGGDLILIYLYTQDKITLLRIGTHSQLF